MTLSGTTDAPYVDNAVEDCTRFELRGWYSNAPGLNANHAFAVGGNGPVNLSVSGGVAAYPAHGLDASALLSAADGALYEAKRLGRNRVLQAAALPLVAAGVRR